MKKLIKKLIEQTGYTLISLSELRNPQRLLPLKIKHFFDLYFVKIDPKKFFFVQIGAHDGKHNDPLHRFVIKYKLHGIALEPQEEVFRELRETYKDYPHVTCVNAAIGEKSGTQTFYTVKGETSLGTFDRNKLSLYEDRIEEISVEKISFSDLVKRFGIEKIDFLQIDCEGYDFEIIKMVDFSKFSPEIINYESVLLSDLDRLECEGLLNANGYKLFRYERDTCAYKL